jgi:ABC-2 type transport system permease protein
MTPSLTFATARRIFAQLRHDPRTIVMLLVMPSILMTLLRFVFNSAREFSAIAPTLLGIFPFIVMFVVTSITTLRERTTFTLERLMTLPMGKLDLLFGYALAFGTLAVIQVAIAATISVTVLGLSITGSIWLLMLITVLDALLGTAIGLFVSAFARTEFQAVQFMPLFVIPQLLLCGLLVARSNMGWLLHWLSNALPLSYAVDALSHVATSTAVDGTLLRNMLIVIGCIVAALALGAATLRRTTS